MPNLTLAPAITRWLAGGDGSGGELRVAVDAATAREALDALFAREPRLRGYLVDEHGALRHHVALFVDGSAVADKATLATPLSPRSEVYVMQALSGG